MSNTETKEESQVSQTSNNQPLLVVGTVAVDSVKTPFGEREQCFGGSASYFSYCSSFFTPVQLCAVVGDDFPEEYRNVLQERDINLNGLEVNKEGKTFRWEGKYEADLNSAITLDTHLNVLLDFDPKVQVNDSLEYLFLANFDPDLQLKVIEQVDKPKLKLTALDTMNFWIESKKESLLNVLKHVDMIVLNDGETRLLTGETNLIKGAKKIREFGPGIVVIKKGEHGVLLFFEDQYFALPAFPLEDVFDPTGAGDTFAGGMMGYLTKVGEVTADTLKQAIAYGTIMASFTVEKFSLDRLRELDQKQIQERFELFRKITNF